MRADKPLLLQVETPNGVFVRRIPPASVLPADAEHGPAAEQATRAAAAAYGLPDFVYRPKLQARASGIREIGDALVIAGRYAAAIQVKSRPAPTGSERRERAWLDHQIARATRQSVGTIRALRQLPTVELQNERGRMVSVDARRREWIPVVIVDHPGVTDYHPTGSAVVLLRRDWEFLFAQLKSTYAVLAYLGRVRDRSETLPLGDEPLRYYRLAAADAASTPSPLDPRLAAVGARATSTPVLPQAPAPFGEIIRWILEDIAAITRPPGTAEEAVLEALEALDSAAVGMRSELGEAAFRMLEQVVDAPGGGTRWWFRRVLGSGRPQLIIGTASRHDELIGGAFADYVALRHQQLAEVLPEQLNQLTVGVLLTPRSDGVRPWDTSLCATRGDQGFEPDIRAGLERLWGARGEWAVAGDPTTDTDPFSNVREPRSRDDDDVASGNE